MAGLPTEPRLSRRLSLTPFRKRDAGPLHDAVMTSLPELHEWLPWAHLTYSRSDSGRFVRDSTSSWREGQAFDFAVRERTGSDRHLGNVSAWFVSKPYRIGEVGYWIRTDLTGNGYCTEAVARVLHVAFDEMGLHRVILRIAVGNRASERVAEKLGFTQEGLLREEIRVRGMWMDHTVWGLLDTEFATKKADYAEMIEA